MDAHTALDDELIAIIRQLTQEERKLLIEIIKSKM